MIADRALALLQSRSRGIQLVNTLTNIFNFYSILFNVLFMFLDLFFFRIIDILKKDLIESKVDEK